MKRFAIVLCGTAFLAAMGLFLATRGPAMAACQSTPDVQLGISGVPAYSGASNQFFDQELTMEYSFPTTSDPDTAWLETVSDTDENLVQGEEEDPVTYSPLFWNPTQGCDGFYFITESGEKVNPASAAEFDAKATVHEFDGPLVDSDTVEVEIP